MDEVADTPDSHTPPKRPVRPGLGACAAVPARLSGLTLPTFDPGQEASFVLARMDAEGLRLGQCVHFGQPYLDRPIRPVETVAPRECGRE